MNLHKKAGVLGCALTLGGAAGIVLATGSFAAAADGPKPTSPDSGDNAWVLTSSALVLLMTAPGLAMFYGGLVRKKNVLGVMMQCVFLMGMNSIIWALFGYSLAFGGDPKSKDFNPWIGNCDYCLMQ